MSQPQVVYNSVINPEYQVFVVFKESEHYATVSETLKSMNNSIGALWVGTKNIFVDGERALTENLTRDHLVAIEAHEIAHSMLNHKAGVDEQSEKEADLLAIALLETFGYQQSATLVKERIQKLYNINYSEFEKEWDESNEEDTTKSDTPKE